MPQGLICSKAIFNRFMILPPFVYHIVSLYNAFEGKEIEVVKDLTFSYSHFTIYLVIHSIWGMSMNEKYERQMKKGVLDMLVLKLLESEPKYGYQIIQEMKEKSGEIFLLKDGTLYPVLYRLEEDGLVVSKWREPIGRQVPRKYYQITASGKQTLGQIQARWKQISDGIKKIMEE